MPDLTAKSRPVVLVFRVVTLGYGFLESSRIAERRKVETFRRGCEDGGVLGEVPIMRLEGQQPNIDSNRPTLYSESSMKSRTSIFTLVGGSLRLARSAAVTLR